MTPNATKECRSSLAWRASGGYKTIRLWGNFSGDRHEAVMPPHQVLVVDDDEDIRESLMEFLADRGYEPLGAGDGREALDKLRSPGVRPCVIILDLMMPIMDGRMFREEQLRSADLSSIPVVIVSALKDTADVARSLNVPNHLPKPLNLDALLQVVRQHCPLS
jgi:DNA-binding response OmpR family regulator